MKCGDCGNEVSKVYSEKLDSCTNCGQMIDIKTPIEPVKIHTEYEHKLERKKLLGSQVATAVFQDEYEKLKRWLEDNKPTNFVPCTRENTKVGAEVVSSINKQKYIIEHIYREKHLCTVWNIREKGTAVNYTLNSFNIDLNNTEE